MTHAYEDVVQSMCDAAGMQSGLAPSECSDPSGACRYHMGVHDALVYAGDLAPLPQPIEGLSTKPTISMLEGTSTLTQCAECGLVACVPDCGSYSHATRLGACPRCGHDKWWRQSSPVSGFVLAAEGQ